MPKSNLRERLKAEKTGTNKKRTSTVEHFITHKHGDFLDAPIKHIKPDPDQPRKEFDDEKLIELSDSIKKHGVLQPLLIRLTDGIFWVVAGERRYRAAKMAGLNSIPCIVTTGDSGEISIIENIQRDDLKPIELANALDRMMKKHGYNQTQLSKIIGKSPRTVSAILSINKLPEAIKEDLSRARPKDDTQSISRRTLVEIAKEPPDKAIAMYDAAKKGEATSDQIRDKRRIKKITKQKPSDKFIGRITVFKKFLDNIDEPKKFLNKDIKNELKSLRDRIDQFLN